jgi:DNA-directed RNA polymerase subunit RPC12/RpoP
MSDTRDEGEGMRRPAIGEMDEANAIREMMTRLMVEEGHGLFAMELPSGGTISLFFVGNCLALEPFERDFVFGLVDRMRAHGSPMEGPIEVVQREPASAPAPEPEQEVEALTVTDARRLEDTPPRPEPEPEPETEAVSEASSGAYACQTCGKVFESAAQMTGHQNAHRPKVACPKCGAMQSAGAGLSSHERRCEGSLRPEASPSPDDEPEVTPLAADGSILHAHRWKLGAPADGLVHGECACGEEKDFPGDPVVSHIGSWAAGRDRDGTR